MALLATGGPIVVTARGHGCRAPGPPGTGPAVIAAAPRRPAPRRRSCPSYGRAVTGVESSKNRGRRRSRTAGDAPDGVRGRLPRVRAHSDLTVHGRQDHGRQGAHTPGPPAGHKRPTAPRPYGTWCWSATRIGQDDSGGGPRADRGGGEPGGPRGGRRHPLRLRRDRAPAAALGAALPGAGRMERHQGQPSGHPGYADFVGELRAGLRAADAALFVVSAADGVDGSTRMVWDECAAVGMPRAIVVTHLEAARADFEEMTRVCAETFGGDDPDAVLPLYLPLRGPEGTGRPRAGDRSDRPAHAQAVRLLQRRARGRRTGRRPGADDRGGTRPADRGDHLRERGRDPHGPLPRR